MTGLEGWLQYSLEVKRTVQLFNVSLTPLQLQILELMNVSAQVFGQKANWIIYTKLVR